MIGRQTISEAARLVAMQVVARSVGDSAHLGFLGAAGCSLGAFLLALTLKESLPPAKHKKIRSLRAVNPFSFVSFNEPRQRPLLCVSACDAAICTFPCPL